jgi:hypothetical protein
LRNLPGYLGSAVGGVVVHHDHLEGYALLRQN